MGTDETRLSVVLLCLEWPGDAHRGGVARYAYRLARELAPLVDLTVVTEEGGQALAGVQMLYIPASTSRLSRYYGQAIRLRRVVKSIKRVDVVHSFGDDWALGRGSWKRVRHFLGMSLSEARSSRGLRRINHYMLAVLEKYSQLRADYRIAIGPESYEAFDCDAIMPPVTKIEPVNVLKTPDPTIVFIGSYRGRKRGWLVERAVKAARASTGRPVQLVVFGPGDDASSWSPETDHRSGARDDEVRSTVSAAWALLSPSEYEGFGIPIFEATSLGTAVVAAPNPGSIYQYRVFTGDSSIRLASSEEEITAALCDQIIVGPELTTTQKKANDHGADILLTAASINSLVDIAYR